eukprot:scaffold120224_cov16-Tisochrysis_lutea.AAC.1
MNAEVGKEGYTIPAKALCAKHPELSVKVLNIHNSILRQAQWMNFGVTHETEGDSLESVKLVVATFCLPSRTVTGRQLVPGFMHPQFTNGHKRKQ